MRRLSCPPGHCDVRPPAAGAALRVPHPCHSPSPAVAVHSRGAGAGGLIFSGWLAAAREAAFRVAFIVYAGTPGSFVAGAVSLPEPHLLQKLAPARIPVPGDIRRSAGRAARTGALSTMARYRSRSYRTERTKHQDRLRGSGHPGGGISRRLSPPGRPARSNAAPVPDFHRGGVWHPGPGAAVAGQPRHALHRPRAEGHRPDAKRMAA